MTESDEQFRSVLDHRYSMLRYLADSPASKPKLVDGLETSRSTVDRAINDLVEIGCVTSENGEYRPTTAGHLAMREHRRYRETTHAVSETTDFINHLPSDTGLDTSLLEQATVTMSKEHAPEQALTPTIDIFERATHMRGLAPVVLNFYPNLISNQLAESDLTVEIIAETDVVTTLPDIPNTGDVSLSDAEGLSLYETDSDIPYALWLMETPTETYAGITAYDSGGPAGVLINDTDAAVQWTETQYEQFRESAQLISASEL